MYVHRLHMPVFLQYTAVSYCVMHNSVSSGMYSQRVVLGKASNELVTPKFARIARTIAGIYCSHVYSTESRD